MSTWSSENAIITNLGNYLLTNARLGKGRIQITRVVARENFEQSIGNARTYTLADITSESIAQTGIILGTRSATYPDPEDPVETSLLTVRFSNDDLPSSDTTYNLRQIVVMGQLIDIPEDNNTPLAEDIGEVPYMVLQCDSSSDCDVMPAREVNPTAFDYDIYVLHSGVDSITVSVRTEGYVWIDDFNDYKEEVSEDLGGLDDKIDSVQDNQIGVNAEGEEVTTWTPYWSDSSFGHQIWGYNDSSSTSVGGDGAERYNSHAAKINDKNNIAVGARSAAFGGFTEALGENSFATGSYNYVDNANSFVGGTKNAVKSVNSASFGTNNELKVNSSNALVTGYANIIENPSDSYYSLTAGENLINRGTDSTIIGKFNDPTSHPEDIAFSIGGGTSDSRRNIVKVTWDSTLYVDNIRVGNVLNPDGTPKEPVTPTIDYIQKGTGVNSIKSNDVVNNIASGTSSTAIGSSTTATGTNSISAGSGSRAEKACSVAVGTNARALGEGSFALGTNGPEVSADSKDCFTFCGAILDGSNKSVSFTGGIKGSDYAFTAGNEPYVYIENADNAIILGASVSSFIKKDNNYPRDDGNDLNHSNFIICAESSQIRNSTFSGILGAQQNKIYSSDYSFTSGYLNEIAGSDSCQAFGSYNSILRATDCATVGLGLSITGAQNNHVTAQVVFGKYNTEDTSKVLIIGNGTDDSNRHNALTVDFSGNIYVNESATSLNSQVATNTSDILGLKSNASDSEVVDDAQTSSATVVIDMTDKSDGIYYLTLLETSNTGISMYAFSYINGSAGNLTAIKETTGVTVSSISLSDNDLTVTYGATGNYYTCLRRAW